MLAKRENSTGMTIQNMQTKQFVIHRHSCGDDVHWDFMLESSGTLQTYRLDKSPAEILHSQARAVKIFDHPLRFLTYEGLVNNGQGRDRTYPGPKIA